MPEDQEPSRLHQRQVKLGSPPQNAGKIHCTIYVDNELTMECIVDEEYAKVLQGLTPPNGIQSASSFLW